jgi:hypothetical protein
VSDISALPGVTAAEVAALAALSLSTTDDLLRSNRSAVAAAVPGLSLARIIKWQAYAELTLIDGIGAAEVAALRAAGADGLGEFAAWAHSRAQAALAGVAADQVAEWQKDALRLTQTGVLNVTVRLKDGTPVAGAEVTVDARTLLTDARGRVRPTRLALDRAFTISVHHPTLGYKLAKGIRASRGSALVGQAFVLAGRRQAPKVLRQIAGDALPPVGTAPMTVKVTPGAPPDTDILMVINRYQGGDARAVSRFLDFEAGRFVRRSYRIKEDDLPAGLSDGDDIEWTGTLWALACYSAAEIARMVRLRAVHRRLPKPPLTAAQTEKAARAVLKALSDPKG